MLVGHSGAALSFCASAERQRPNPSIERTAKRPLRGRSSAAHVKR